MAAIGTPKLPRPSFGHSRPLFSSLTPDVGSPANHGLDGRERTKGLRWSRLTCRRNVPKRTVSQPFEAVEEVGCEIGVVVEAMMAVPLDHAGAARVASSWRL